MTAVTVEKESRKTEDDREQIVVVQVLDQLGSPKDLFRVDAKPLWDDHFRVNVFRALQTERSVRNVAVTDSFFVTLTGDGIVSRPPIEPKYS